MCKTVLIRILILLLGLLPIDGTAASTFRPHGPLTGNQPSDQKAQDLFKQALLHISVGDERSRQLIEEAVQIWTQVHHPDKAARALMQLGQSYMRENGYLISLHFYKRALE